MGGRSKYNTVVVLMTLDRHNIQHFGTCTHNMQRYTLIIALLAGVCTASKGVQCCRAAHSIQRWILAAILCFR